MFSLLPGIKRSAFRDNDPRATQADAVFAVKRPAALERARYKCKACEYASPVAPKKPSRLQVHHGDDNHHNNDDQNLLPICSLCHGYPHLGCSTASTGGGGEIASKAHLAAIPELSAADMNNLLRAIGAAMNDPAEREMAQTIYSMLCERVRPVAKAYGTSTAADFALGMAQLSDVDYKHRGDAVKDLRVMFRQPVLEQVGKEMLEDHPSLKPSTWGVVYGELVDELLEEALAE